MSDYILCQVKKASLPFYVENISKNIYSIEELCYYIYKNIYLIDESIINERLCNWIKDELGLPRLYENLYRILEKEEGTSAFILAIFREIHYLSYDEFKRLNEELEILEKQLLAVRIKKKGDYLVSNRMYVNAIRMYEDALVAAKREENLGVQFEGEIYNNMGYAYLELFQMEEAAKYLKKAYEKLPTQQIRKQYFYTCRMFMDEGSWREECESMGADETERKAIVSEMNQIKPKQTDFCAEEIDDMLSDFKKEYHRSTGF